MTRPVLEISSRRRWVKANFAECVPTRRSLVRRQARRRTKCKRSPYIGWVPADGIGCFTPNYSDITKFLLLVSALPGVVPATGPVFAPLETTAVKEVSETTLKLVAGTPLKVTLVAPVSACQGRKLRRLRARVAGGLEDAGQLLHESRCPGFVSA
jgi:hypothetical protein